MEIIFEGLKEIGKFLMWFALGFGVVAVVATLATTLINLFY